MSKKKKQKSIFWQEVDRDINTFKSLHGKKRFEFVMDYYKWYIVAGLFSIFVIIIFANMLYQGHKPVRLDVCCVLNDTERDATAWFDKFEERLLSDGNTDHGGVRVDKDQPFDYDNVYSNVLELEIYTKVASRRMDAAICNPDLYKYLLSINAICDLSETLPEEDVKALKKSGTLVSSVAGITEDENGKLDKSDSVKGYFAVDISDTAFAKNYNKGQKDKLYAVIIKNGKHKKDCITFLQNLYNNK